MGPIDLHSVEIKILGKSMEPINCLVTGILQNINCTSQNKVSQTGLERLVNDENKCN